MRLLIVEDSVSLTEALESVLKREKFTVDVAHDGEEGVEGQPGTPGSSGSINIPVDTLRDRLAEIPKEKDIFLICQSALRSYIACKILTAHGYRCSHLSGGYRFYKSAMEGNTEYADRLCGECGAPLR